MKARSVLPGVAILAAGAHLACAEPISIEMAAVGRTANAPDPATGFGAVRYAYAIGKYHVTIGQYVRFLNAVAKRDPHQLYNPRMATDLMVAGISRSGASGAYVYAAMEPSGGIQSDAATAEGRPVTYVSWFDAARFANWMANGQPTGAEGNTTTEDGAYHLAGATSGRAVPRNRVNPNTGGEPSFYLPSENQWYKAAYYGPRLNRGRGGYYLYATASDTAPGNIAGNEANMANYIDDYNGSYFYAVPQTAYIDLNQNYLLDSGAYAGSPSYYGTFDQSGAVYDWNDLDGAAGPARGLRIGFYFAGSASIQSVTYAHVSPAREGADAGFRLAGPAR